MRRISGLARSRVISLLLGPLVCASLALASEPVSPEEEVAQARAVKLATQLASEDLDAQRDAAYALADLGPSAKPAVPALIEALKDEDQQVWFMSLMALARIGPDAAEAVPALIEGLSSRDEQRWYRSAFALGKIGEPAVEALRPLLTADRGRQRAGAVFAMGWMENIDADRALRLLSFLADPDDEVRQRTEETFVRWGEPAIPWLVPALSHDDPHMRGGSARILAENSSLPEYLIEPLAALVHDEHEPTREAAVAALGKLATPDDRVRAALAEALGDESFEVRQQAGWAVLRIGDWPDALTGLVRLLESSHDEDMQLAAYVLSRLRPVPEKAWPALLNAVYRAEEEQVHRFVDAVLRIGPEVIPLVFQGLESVHKATEPHHLERSVAILKSFEGKAVPALLDGLEADALAPRLAAIQALSQIPDVPPETVHRLSPALESPEPEIRATAAVALGRLAGDDEQITKRLVQAFTDPHPIVRMAVLEALRNSSTSLAERESVWAEALQDELPEVREAALSEISQMERPPEGTVELVASQLHMGSAATRVAAAKALARYGKAAEVAGDELISASRQEEPELREAACAALAELATKSKDPAAMVAALSAAVADAEPVVRHTAIVGLQRIGEPAAEYLSTLVERLAEEPKASSRAALIKAIAAIESRKQNVVPSIVPSLADDDWDVRRVAAETLGDLEDDAQEAVPAMFERLTNEEDRPALVRALRRIDVAPVEAVPLFIDGLRSEHRYQKYFAIRFLKEMGADAAQALPALREQLALVPQRYRDDVQETIDAIEAASSEEDAD